MSVADRIADRSGLGEALTGAAFLGVTTSLSGSIVSLTAPLAGNAELFRRAFGTIMNKRSSMFLW